MVPIRVAWLGSKSGPLAMEFMSFFLPEPLSSIDNHWSANMRLMICIGEVKVDGGDS